MIRWLLLVLMIISGAGPSYAVLPDEMLPNAAQEARARAISLGLRCLVCQNQSIDDSGATLAKDLRVIVRERIVAGETDTQVTDYVVSRYGNFVLLKPPFQADTALLWILPFAMLIVALGLVYRYLRQQPQLNEADANNDILKSD